jgi:replicative DNA helicase
MSQLIDASMAMQFDRLPPHSIESEMCVLASMILDEKCIPEIRLSLKSDSFFDVVHQTIFKAMCRMWDAGTKVDGMTLRHELMREQALDEVGGLAYLGQILNSVPSAAHAVHYAKAVRETWILRSIIETGNTLLRKCYEKSTDPQAEHIAQDGITQLVQLIGSAMGAGSEHFGDVVGRVIDDLMAGGKKIISSGFRAVDVRTGGGFMLGEMWLLGGRPSSGKSTVAKQMAIRMAKAGVPVAIITVEETNAKIARNVLSFEAQVENRRLRNGRSLNTEDWTRLSESISRLSSLPLWLCERARTLNDIRSELSLLVARHGVRAVFVDYMQLIHAHGEEYERITSISQGMVRLVKDLNVVGVVLAQLNRELEKRPVQDRRPRLADLRGSGSLEQDADGILFLFREDYYRASESGYELQHIAELEVAKQRDGARGDVAKLKTDLRFLTFDDLPPESGGDDSTDRKDEKW